MNDLFKRRLLFLAGCVPVRVLMVYMAAHLKPPYIQWMAIAVLAPIIGFLYLYITNSRLTATETYGAKIWWHQLRIVHALLYTWFVVDVFAGKPNAYLPLAIDLVIGLTAFIIVHSMN